MYWIKKNKNILRVKKEEFIKNTHKKQLLIILN